jgi:hypothetical protein
MGKSSLFTKDGKFKNEIKIKAGTAFKPFGKSFIGRQNYSLEDKTRMYSIRLYDQNIDNGKMIYHRKSSLQLQRGRGYRIYSAPFDFFPCDGKIFVLSGNELSLEAMDETGKKLFLIKEEYERVKFTESHKSAILNFFKTDPRFSQVFERIKSILVYPDFFPAVRSVHPAGKKIYIRTFKKKDDKTEVYIYSSKGKLLEKCFLPIAEMNARESYPFTFANDNLYQLVEDVDAEEWAVKVTKK